MTKSDKPRQLDGKKLAYVDWLLDRNKDPRTRSAWAQANDVSRDTLWEWERSDWLTVLVDELLPKKQAVWAAAMANLERIALQERDDQSAIAAIRELGKLLKKYPSERLEVTGKQGLLEWLGSTQEPVVDKRAN